MKINVVDGDITRIPADALITAINSGGMWFGGVDRAIMRVAGDQYHAQLSRRLEEARNEDPAHVSSSAFYVLKAVDHDCRFDDVIFVIDDLDRPIDELVYQGLELALDNACQRVLLPAIRLGVMKDVAGTPEEKVAGVASALKFWERSALEEASVVIYNDLTLSNQFREALSIPTV